MTPNEIASATHAAMLTLPPYAELARALDADDDSEARLALLASVDDITRHKALEYIASSRVPEMRERARCLAWMRQDVQRVAWLKKYYADPKHTADFIAEWVVTIDPRNIERGLPAMVPFALFPRQRELVDWIIARWQGSEGGIVIKPRDAGVSWVILAVACTLCLFNRDLVVGFGSRKEEYVDKLGAPKALFSKARTLMSALPPEFELSPPLRRNSRSQINSRGRLPHATLLVRNRENRRSSYNRLHSQSEKIRHNSANHFYLSNAKKLCSAGFMPASWAPVSSTLK